MNLTSLYDFLTEMSQQLKTVTKSLEETKDKLNTTEKNLSEVTKELEQTKKQLNATEEKLNTGEVILKKIVSFGLNL